VFCKEDGLLACFCLQQSLTETVRLSNEFKNVCLPQEYHQAG